MHRFIQLLTSAVAVAAADPIVTSLLLPYNDPGHFVATVLNVDASATTFAYTCASTVDADDCGMSTHATIVQGPSTWRMTLSQSDDDGFFALTAACTLTPSRNAASCSVSQTESDSESQGSSTKTGATTSYLADLQAVTLVAGLDKLTGGATPLPGTGSSTPTSGAAGSSGSQPQNTGGASQSVISGGAASPSGAASASASASGSKTGTPNAAPAVTQQAVLVGVAAVVGALAL